MKSVLISIQPYWVFLIIAKTMGWNVDKEKTVEVRKTFPKDKNWNKVAKIYCSKDKNSFAKIPSQYKPLMEQFLGKVIGEFVCDNIVNCLDINMDSTCLTVPEWLKYTKGHKGNVWGWHISNLVIYDKPKGLRAFWQKGGVFNGKRDNIEDLKFIGTEVYKPITRPPQSWCYVENDFKE